MWEYNQARCCIACAVILIMSAGGVAESSIMEMPRPSREERKICRELCSVTIKWLEDGEAADSEECDKLIDTLLSLENASVKAYLIAAQTASLRGRSEKALSILRKVAEEHPNETAGIMNVPVGVLAHCWMATIAGQSGDTDGARSACETALRMLKDSNSGMATVVSLYLAEIELSQPNRREQGIGLLRGLASRTHEAPRLGQRIFSHEKWAAYIEAKTTQGATQAAKAMVIEAADVAEAPVVAAVQLRMRGITDVPFADYCPDKRVDIVSAVLLKRAIDSHVSEIDASCARLAYGVDCERKGKRNEAIQQYSQLFGMESFLSPIAGLYLMRVRSASNEGAESSEILRVLKSRHPLCVRIDETIPCR